MCNDTQVLCFRHKESLFLSPLAEIYTNKKGLLRERRRHTVRRVASAHYADLSPDREVPHPVLDGGGRVPHPVLFGGTPSSPGWGSTPIQS